MGLFEHFPFTNFHELNLDWIIEQVKNTIENAVMSVNGQTGEVILYQDPDIVFPDVNSNTWRMVRTAGGNVVGVMFQNGLMYVMNGNQASRVYTTDNPPAYPVTSVNGQTGAVVLYPDAGVRFPDVDDAYMNMRRQIDSAGTPAIVGIEVDKTKAKRMNGTSRYDIYDAGNPPPYPVTSVNGQTGAIILAIPFDDLSDSVWMASEVSEDHIAGLARETIDGTVSIYTVTTGTDAAAYLHFVSADDQYSYTKKLLTTDDIPSSSGVVSINGMTGVVTIYGNTMPIENGSSDTVADVIEDLKGDLAIIENTNTATHNIAKGHFVCWNGFLYIATANIAISDTLSISNLTPVNNGGLNDLQEHIFVFPGDSITTDTAETVAASLSGSAEDLHFSIPIQKNLEYVSTATITALAGSFRVAGGGYLNGLSYNYLANATSVSVTIDKHAGMLKVKLSNTDKWTTTVPNNSPMVASISYTITFN